MRKYTPKEVEAKWQKVWAETNIYEVSEDTSKEKIYATPMLPYPSGAGLHVGHVRNYSIADAVARFYRQRGYNVMSNIGWDTFGLPAENYAIKTGTPPAKSTAENIANFKVQLKRLGISYAWDREVNTADPEYYKWTQWIFKQLFDDGLAYQAENLQWWCTNCKTVLANEQVENGKCWRHDGPDDPLVERRMTNQWFFKITNYADALLDQLDNLDWPESITTQQRNWIGRSSGAEINFEIDGGEQISVFTTRPDTIYGATFMVLAPENPLVDKIVAEEQRAEVADYAKETVKKSDIDRMAEGREKTGVFTGAFATNPANDQKIPIWVSDFVLATYGTGAIMAVPGHDQRDFEFATKFELPIINVINPVHIRADVKDTEDFHEKQKIVAIVENQDSQILTINWGDKLGGRLFVGGTIEGGESASETALRELKEESGYIDAEVISEGDETFHYKYFASSKNRAVAADTKFVHLKLRSDKQQAQKLEADEKGKFKVEWVSPDDAKREVTEVLHSYAFDKFILGNSYAGEGTLSNSGPYDGVSTFEARDKIVADLEKKKVAKEKINYRIRDWLISRQRYWGAPIPIIHCSDCGPVSVPEKDLPVILPEVEDYQPTGGATSVLATVEDWVNVDCPKCGKDAKRETDTMDGYACSSWYMHRYTDSKNDKMAWDPEKVNYWFPVDFYFGGDHAVSHLLYFRFWNHYFVDKGLVKKEALEPVKRLVFNGYINAQDGRKMSKSLGNVVDPLDIIDSGYGADALRMFELFVGPYDQDVLWNPNGVPGTYRFIQRVWTLAQELIETEATGAKPDPEKAVMLSSAVHKTIKKVTGDLEKHRFNTAIAACMELVNTLNALKADFPMASAHVEWRTSISQLLQLLAPFAPHMAEELWDELGFEESIHLSGWPLWDKELVKEAVVTVAVQVNGKVRATLEVEIDTDEAVMIELAEAEENVQNFIKDKQVVKKIYVPNKIVNFVVK